MSYSLRRHSFNKKESEFWSRTLRHIPSSTYGYTAAVYSDRAKAGPSREASKGRPYLVFVVSASSLFSSIMGRLSYNTFIRASRYLTWPSRHIFYPQLSYLLLSQRRVMASIQMSQPSIFPSSRFDIIDSSEKFEEETLPDYLKERYYPVHIGDVLKSQYQVITKLGFGSSSTVWLCRDLRYVCTDIYLQYELTSGRNERYLVLKVHVRTRRQLPEIEISKHLSAVHDAHGGEKYVRLVLGSFEVPGPDGVHPCLLCPPAGIDIRDYIRCLEGDPLPENLLRPALRFVLIALDYLHQAKVIHTGKE